MTNKYLVLALLLFCGINTYSQSDSRIILSNNSAEQLTSDIRLLNLQLATIIEQNDSLTEFNNKLISNNYMLNNKLQAERFRGELFDGILSEQTMRFIFMMLLISITGAVIVIYAVRDKGKQLERRFNKGLDDITKASVKGTKRQTKLEEELFTSLANINFSLGRQYSHDQNYLAAVNYSLKSADFIHKTIIDEKGNPKDGSSGISIRLLSLLTTVLSYIDSIPRTNEGIESYRSLFPDLMDSLEELTRSPIGELNAQASVIRAKLIELEKL